MVALKSSKKQAGQALLLMSISCITFETNGWYFPKHFFAEQAIVVHVDNQRISMMGQILRHQDDLQIVFVDDVFAQPLLLIAGKGDQLRELEVSPKLTKERAKILYQSIQKLLHHAFPPSGELQLDSSHSFHLGAVQIWEGCPFPERIELDLGGKMTVQIITRKVECL